MYNIKRAPPAFGVESLSRGVVAYIIVVVVITWGVAYHYHYYHYYYVCAVGQGMRSREFSRRPRGRRRRRAQGPATRTEEKRISSVFGECIVFKLVGCLRLGGVYPSDDGGGVSVKEIAGRGGVCGGT